MSAEIKWGHATTYPTEPPALIGMMHARAAGRRGARWASVRPSAGGEWTEFETGGSAIPELGDIADDGGIEVRFGLKPRP